MTNLLLFAFLFSSVLLQSHLCQKCPPVYLRYSKSHSFCVPKNFSCPIFHSSVSPAEMKQIVDLHNMYRNLVATGGEKQAGGLPQAADMLQMVWDWELSAVAQKRAENCFYAHDCYNCRRVENFKVGQNIAYLEKICPVGIKCSLDPVANWARVIKLFYDEVAMFNKRYVNAVDFPPEAEFGHLTQMIWSKTWRIGCGYVAYQKGNGYRQFYVCNYGPEGNNVNRPVYRTGAPCSGCPLNSCCGKTCKRVDYTGLCRMNRNNEVPTFPSTQKFFFHCDFRSTGGDCSNSVFGYNNKWRFVNALGGTFEEVVLNGGEATTLKFKKIFRGNRRFCLTTKYRFGPTIDGQKISGRASITLDYQNLGSRTYTLPSTGKEFLTFNMDVGPSFDFLVSFVFSAPAGLPAQYFNIQYVTAKHGKC